MTRRVNIVWRIFKKVAKKLQMNLKDPKVILSLMKFCVARTFCVYQNIEVSKIEHFGNLKKEKRNIVVSNF